MTKLFENHPEITDVKAYKYEDLKKTDFYQQNKALLDKGPSLTEAAGNMQKIYLIKEELKIIPKDSYLLYHDSSPEVWNTSEINKGKNFSEIPNNFYNNISLTPYIKKCDENNGILLGTASFYDDKSNSSVSYNYNDKKVQHTHKYFTSPTCIKLMGLEKYTNDFQAHTTWILLKNTDHVNKIISETLEYNTNEDCASYTKNIKIDKEINPDFIENRGDQSILSLLLSKYGMTSHLLTNRKDIFSNN